MNENEHIHYTFYSVTFIESCYMSKPISLKVKKDYGLNRVKIANNKSNANENFVSYVFLNVKDLAVKYRLK